MTWKEAQQTFKAKRKEWRRTRTRNELRTKVV